MNSVRRHLVKHVLLLALLAGVFVAPLPVRAQALDGKSALLLRDIWLADLDVVHSKIVALAQAIPEDKYGWRPTPEVRTVAGALMHVSVEWYFGLPVSAGGKFPADLPPFPEANPMLLAVTGKTAVLDHLEKAWTHGRSEVAAATEAQLMAARLPIVDPPAPFERAMFIMSGDLHEHLGQLIAYARSIGVKPPWSK